MRLLGSTLLNVRQFIRHYFNNSRLNYNLLVKDLAIAFAYAKYINLMPTQMTIQARCLMIKLTLVGGRYETLSISILFRHTAFFYH